MLNNTNSTQNSPSTTTRFHEVCKNVKQFMISARSRPGLSQEPCADNINFHFSPTPIRWSLI